MTYLEAAYRVLSDAHEPLHYSEITRRALEQQLLQSTGLTPDATMAAGLYSDTQEEDTRFVRVGKGKFDLAKPRQGGIEEQVEQINKRTRERLRELLLGMPAKRFESLVMALLLKMGFDEGSLRVTPYSRDGGIDVFGVYRAAGLAEVSAAVQAKRWKSNIQAPAITQLRGSLEAHQQGIIITTSDFSQGARVEAVAQGKRRIALINGDELVELLIKHRVGAIEKRLIVDALDEEWWGELLNVQPPPDRLSARPAPTATPAEAAEPLVAPPSPKPADGHQNGSPTGHKPASITLFGHIDLVKSWKDVLVTMCTRLYEKHGGDFVTAASAMHGRKRHYFAESPDGILAPQLIPGTFLYVETNMSAQGTLNLCQALLNGLAYGPSEMEISFAD